MKQSYFNNVNTLSELRRQYKELLKRFHPDNKNGSEEITKAINIEYEILFNRIKSNRAADNKETSESAFNWKEDEKLREMINNIITLDQITIEIVGNWIWLSGNTYAYRKDLHEFGFRFAGKKKMWYWHSESFKKKSHKILSMDQIRNYYGGTTIEKERRKYLA